MSLNRSFKFLEKLVYLFCGASKSMIFLFDLYSINIQRFPQLDR